MENTVRGWALAWSACAGETGEHDWSFGMGGVMLASSEWAGGLCDRMLGVSQEQREAVEPELSRAIRVVTQNVFRYRGLSAVSAESCQQPLVVDHPGRS